MQRRLAAERKSAHGELCNQILQCGTQVQTEKLSYKGWQKGLLGKSVGKRTPGMFVSMLRGKAERAGGAVVDLNTWSLRLSQYDYTTETYTKKPLSLRVQVLGDGSGSVQRDMYSAFLAYCVQDQKLLSSQVCANWESRKHALLAGRRDIQKSAKGEIVEHGVWCSVVEATDANPFELIAGKDVLATVTALSEQRKPETPLRSISKSPSFMAG